MKKILISDFSKVQLFPKNLSYTGGLNKLYKEITSEGKEFNDYFVLNTFLLDELEKLEIDKYVFTTKTVQNAPEIKDRVQKVFTDIYNLSIIGYLKTDPRAYSLLCHKIGVNENQAMFIDDTKGNVEAAIQAGLYSVVYESNEQILKSIKDWL